MKHLVVLADFGGEQIQRLNLNFESVFPSVKPRRGRYFEFYWHKRKYIHYFEGLPSKGTLNNAKLGIDGKNLLEKQPLDTLKRDMIMILLFGSNSADTEIATKLRKCEIGDLLGKPEELERYVRQKYILVSRITGGAEANSLGQVAQHYVEEFLRKSLPSDFEITPYGHVAGVTHTEGRKLSTFDIVVAKGSKSVAVEVSFQVTTNSTIERKAGQAKPRYDMIKKTGNYIAYVIDGAGNFQRTSAISTICRYSDCTVGFSDEEFGVLISFISGVL
ncbi:MAG: restriction endonuclease [Candidatus Thermoplasmatota archaeon]|nr:restriction endonuclease [Candidatus Thermoplasmatota archaeon]